MVFFFGLSVFLCDPSSSSFIKKAGVVVAMEKDLSVKWSLLLLVLLFLVVGGLKSYFALSSPTLQDGQAYYTLDQVGAILETGHPRFNDPYSYRGARVFFLPGFYYVLAFFALFIPELIVVKIVPAFLMASLVFPLYVLSHYFFKQRHVALLTAFAGAFVPVFWSTVNSVSPYTLVLPLLLWVLYAFFAIEKRMIAYFVLFGVLLLTHPSVVLFVLALLFYFILLKTEHLTSGDAELEMGLFSLFSLLWVYLILFKKLFALHGISFIWLNLPSQLIDDIFARFSILTGIYQISIIPFCAGIFAIYYFVFRRQHPKVYLLISFAILALLLIWFGFFPLQDGLLILGMLLVLLASFTYKEFLAYFEKTKFASHVNLVILGIVVLFVVTAVLPSLHTARSSVSNSLSQEEIGALMYLKDVTPFSAVIFGNVEDGFLLSTFAHRRNIIEPHFLMAKDAEERYSDVKRIFTTESLIEALTLLEKYEADYVYLSRSTIFNPDANTVKFNNKCFQLVYDNIVKIYHIECHVREIS